MIFILLFVRKERKHMRVMPRHKWEILQYLGCALPKLSALQKGMIREQLDRRYCSHCGEYIYNPFRRRNIRHFHHLHRKHRFVPLLQQRVFIHAHTQLVEWTRRFPHVMRLLISETDLSFYRGFQPQYVHRLCAVRMWTVDEWNTLYPTLPIGREDCLQRIKRTDHIDCLYTPDLVLI